MNYIVDAQSYPVAWEAACPLETLTGPCFSREAQAAFGILGCLGPHLHLACRPGAKGITPGATLWLGSLQAGLAGVRTIVGGTTFSIESAGRGLAFGPLPRGGLGHAPIIAELLQSFKTDRLDVELAGRVEIKQVDAVPPQLLGGLGIGEVPGWVHEATGY